MKKWNTPKLIVLVRGKPEECILTSCKFGEPVASPDYVFVPCYGSVPTDCSLCLSELPS
jgi:hypothetical protein